MATTFTTKLQPGISVTGVKTDPAWHKASTSPNLSDNVSLAHGTGADKADLIYTTRIALAISAVSNVDLSGALKDIFGDTAIFVKVKGVYVHNRSDDTSPTTAAAITLTGNFITVSYGTAASIPLAAGDSWQHNSGGVGLAVTAGTGDVITVTNTSGTESAEVDLIIVGTSA